MERDYPILEYDNTPEALIEPCRVIRPKDVPEHAVVCFFHEVIEGLCQQHGACMVHPMRSEMGLHPVYELKVESKRLAVFAVAQFRGVEFGQLLYGGDDVGGADWDARDWWDGHASTREKLFWLAAAACLAL